MRLWATVTIALAAGFALGRFSAWWRTRGADRMFERDFAQLAASMDVDVEELAGPGPAALTDAGRPRTHAVDPAELNPLPLSERDRAYYLGSWGNVIGEFSRSPASALLLAQHLTANLLVNRGLVPADTARPTRLPESWDFPSARGYARARHIGERAETQAAHGRGLRTLDLADALRMFEAFYMEMLELETEDPAAEC
ncbi:hypothetical protein [Actinospica robiniae]|uniref:hypothetical protein n=1 Tax=Actinospica robiniae TaxID=304901 RepID=UPI0004031FC4|nr:hypothetical protein [Actinospica robiniae]